jgi:DNA-binding CsgD family transcriptional regulator
VSGGTALLEREAELGRIERVLDAASAGEGSVTVISGDAGVGKTALMEAGVRGARSVGAKALLARASELEREFSFGVARQLLEAPVLERSGQDRAGLFTGAAAPAATVLDLEDAPDLERDPLITLHALYWLVVNLSSSSPLILAVDDLQWSDEMSLRALAYLARRLEGLPVALICTLRTGEAQAEAASQAIDEIIGRAETARIEPEALGEGAVAELLATELDREVAPGFAAACRELTGGNPFLLSELAAEIAAEGIEPSDRSGGVEALVPRRVGQMARRRLARLSDDARTLADAVAVLGDGEELGAAGAMAELDPDAATAAASELVAARIFADASGLRFRHPLLRSAVVEEIPGPERAAGHARAARIIAGRGASPAQVAPHLLLSPVGEGDPWAVEKLREAARSALSQGDAEHAARFLARALEEPPPPEQRAELLEETAHAEFTVLRPTAADRFGVARDLAQDPAARAKLGLGQGMALYYLGQHAAAVDVLTEAADEAEPDAELREQWLTIEAFLALAGRYDLATKDRVQSRTSALASALTGETPGERLILAFVESQNPAGTAELLVRATDMEVETFGTAPWRQPAEGVGAVAMYVHAGRPEKARALADRLAEQATEESSPLKHAMAVGAGGVVSLDVGALPRAADEFREAAGALEEFGAELLIRGNSAFHLTTIALMGDTDRAEAMLTAYDLGGELPEQMIFNPMLFARAQLRIEQRRFEEADADLEELGRRQARWGILRPSPPWRSARALVLRALGEPAAGRRLAEEELGVALRWGTPKAIALAKRSLGLLSDGASGTGLLEEAEALLADTPWRLDHARARFDLGAALRRAGERRRGRELLAQAMDEAQACGAEPLAEQAAEELRASGARPRRRAVAGIDALTPSEVRVARLAAAGSTNREIAEELFVTMATVETHLTRVYRKLDLDGRDGLADALPEA